ncbi:apolipoprotein N-acyltransferase [Brachybacterium horti]
MTATRSGARSPARRRDAEHAAELVPTPWPIALLCGVAGGVACLVAFPPYGLWPLLPVSVALLVAGVMVRSAVLAVLVSLLWGLAFFVPLTVWANTYAGAMPWIALGIFESLSAVLFGLLARTVIVRRGLRASSCLVVAALWTGVELLRSHAPWGGLPWGTSAYALSESPLLNLGPWIGTAGLALVVGILGMLLLHGVLALTGRTRRGLRGVAGVWPLSLAVGLVLVTVVVPLPQNRAPEGRSSMTIAGIQGNMDPIDPATLTMPDGVYENHLQVTRDTITTTEEKGGQLELVVWPEDSTEYDPRQDPVRSAQLAQASADAGAPILVGTQTLVGDHERLNHSLLYTADSADGDVPYTYAKRHPVPFGEYIPARSFFRVLTDKVDLVGYDMLPGQEVGVMDLASITGDEDSAKVGVLICFEIAYDNLVQDTVRDGAEVIVVQSNTALFGDSDESIQQLAQAKVMAVVSGRSVVHVATVGESAIFSPEGRRLSSVGHWEQGALLAEVPLRTGITPAVAAGPWIGIGISAIGLIGLLGALGTRRRALPTPRRRDRDRPRTRS